MNSFSTEICFIVGSILEKWLVEIISVAAGGEVSSQCKIKLIKKLDKASSSLTT